MVLLWLCLLLVMVTVISQLSQLCISTLVIGNSHRVPLPLREKQNTSFSSFLMVADNVLFSLALTAAVFSGACCQLWGAEGRWLGFMALFFFLAMVATRQRGHHHSRLRAYRPLQQESSLPLCSSGLRECRWQPASFPLLIPAVSSGPWPKHLSLLSSLHSCLACYHSPTFGCFNVQISQMCLCVEQGNISLTIAVEIVLTPSREIRETSHATIPLTWIGVS